MQGNLDTQETNLQLEPWNDVHSKKRLRYSPDNAAERPIKQTKIDDYWLGQPITATRNRFEVLTENQEESIQTKEKEETKVPPIFVSGVQNIKPLSELLIGIAENDFTLKILSGNQVKIQPKTSKTYSAIFNALREKKTDFHTYQFKQDRNFKVVLKGIHYSTSDNEIKTAIEELGYEVANVFNIRQNRTKKPLSMFYVDIKPNVNNKDIYNVSLLLNAIVKFEPPIPKRDIPQCVKCQRYGHTKAFCHRSPRCVKCAGDHLTIACTRKEKSNDVKCILCSGNHPANYKGCTVYKDIQKKSFPQLRKKQYSSNIAAQNPIRAGTSYAAVTKNEPQHMKFTGQSQHTKTEQEQNQISGQSNNDIQELKQMMKALMEQMSTMLNILTALVTKAV